jgi:acetate kinase
MEAYRLKIYVGMYAASLGSLDAIVFTAGAGECDPVLRKSIITGSEQFGIKIDREKNLAAVNKKEALISTDDSRVKIFVIPTNEEIVFIEDVVAILEGRYRTGADFKYSFESEDYVP